MNESLTIRNTAAPGLSVQALKVIAIISMIIDHTGYAILYNMPSIVDPDSMTYTVYCLFRLIGRLAFPIYCFMLIEGITHTHSALKYSLRMLVFAVISEIPFDLAFSGVVFDWEYQNVFFTLFLGVLMLWAFEWVRKGGVDKLPGTVLRILVLILPTAYFVYSIGKSFGYMLGFSGLPEKLSYVLTGIIALILIYITVSYVSRKYSERTALILCADLIILSAAALAADLMRTDYDSAGVIAIAVMYLYRTNYVGRMISGCMILALLSSPAELFAILDIPLIMQYNRQRGRGSRILFYIVYPSHLLILYLIAYLMGLRSMAGVM